MITSFISGKANFRVEHFHGASTDDKPTSDRFMREDQSTFTETDTGRMFLWNSVSDGWRVTLDPVADKADRDSLRAENAAVRERVESAEARLGVLEDRPEPRGGP